MNTRPFLLPRTSLLPDFRFARQDPLSGAWELPRKTTDIDLYGTLSVRILPAGTHVTVVQRWGGGRSFLDSLDLPLDGTAVSVPVTHRVFPVMCSWD